MVFVKDINFTRFINYLKTTSTFNVIDRKAVNTGRKYVVDPMYIDRKIVGRKGR